MGSQVHADVGNVALLFAMLASREISYDEGYRDGENDGLRYMRERQVPRERAHAIASVQAGALKLAADECLSGALRNNALASYHAEISRAAIRSRDDCDAWTERLENARAREASDDEIMGLHREVLKAGAYASKYESLAGDARGILGNPWDILTIATWLADSAGFYRGIGTYDRSDIHTGVYQQVYEDAVVKLLCAYRAQIAATLAGMSEQAQ